MRGTGGLVMKLIHHWSFVMGTRRTDALWGGTRGRTPMPRKGKEFGASLGCCQGGVRRIASKLGTVLI